MERFQISILKLIGIKKKKKDLLLGPLEKPKIFFRFLNMPLQEFTYNQTFSYNSHKIVCNSIQHVESIQSNENYLAKSEIELVTNNDNQI